MEVEGFSLFFGGGWFFFLFLIQDRVYGTLAYAYPHNIYILFCFLFCFFFVDVSLCFKQCLPSYTAPLLTGEFHLRLRHLEQSLLQALNEVKGRILDDDR